MYFKVVLLLNLLTTNCGFLVPDSLQVVPTRNGEIHGILSNVEFDGQQYQVKKFLGIPYAEPPVGNLRFRKPLPVRPFSSPFKATKFSPSCPQTVNANMSDSISEDCLYLNIYVPTGVEIGVTQNKPVMVWIHGGGFVLGSGGSYDVDKLSVFTDTIVVTINYRLGALGFFNTRDRAAPGNYGLWDQHQALVWVHDNIADFGGNPDQVTIFGESAGSSSVIYQTVYPGNRGLFKRAIAESGTMAAWGSSPSDVTYESSISFATTIGCNETEHEKIVSCLRNIPGDKMIKSTIDHSAFTFPFAKWVPVYDDDFVFEEPMQIFKTMEKQPKLFSSFHEIDLLLGWNNLDGFVYLGNWLQATNKSMADLANLTLARSEFESYYIPNIAIEALQMTPTGLTKNVISQEYKDFDDPNNSNGLINNLANLSTDALLAAPSVLTAHAHVSSTGNTFLYRFAARPPYRLGLLPTVLESPNAANHADELFYVLGINFYADYVFPDPSKIPVRTPEEMRLTKTMMTMWSNFAKSGDPNSPIPIKPYFDVHWDSFTSDNPMFLEISLNMTQTSVKSSRNLRGVDFWNNIVPRIQNLSK